MSDRLMYPIYITSYFLVGPFDRYQIWQVHCFIYYVLAYPLWRCLISCNIAKSEHINYAYISFFYVSANVLRKAVWEVCAGMVWPVCWPLWTCEHVIRWQWGDYNKPIWTRATECIFQTSKRFSHHEQRCQLILEKRAQIVALSQAVFRQQHMIDFNVGNRQFVTPSAESRRQDQIWIILVLDDHVCRLVQTTHICVQLHTDAQIRQPDNSEESGYQLLDVACPYNSPEQVRVAQCKSNYDVTPNTCVVCAPVFLVVSDYCVAYVVTPLNTNHVSQLLMRNIFKKIEKNCFHSNFRSYDFPVIQNILF